MASASWSAIQRAPWALPDSSSATAKKIRSPVGRKPLSARLRKATAWEAVRFNMSTAPRPQTSPSTTSPSNGSRLQPSGFTGTTSVWPIRHREGAAGSDPSMRATSEVRPGVGS